MLSRRRVAAPQTLRSAEATAQELTRLLHSRMPAEPRTYRLSDSEFRLIAGRARGRADELERVRREFLDVLGEMAAQKGLALFQANPESAILAAPTTEDARLVAMRLDTIHKDMGWGRPRRRAQGKLPPERHLFRISDQQLLHLAGRRRWDPDLLQSTDSELFRLGLRVLVPLHYLPPTAPDRCDQLVVIGRDVLECVRTPPIWPKNRAAIDRWSQGQYLMMALDAALSIRVLQDADAKRFAMSGVSAPSITREIPA